MTLRVSEHTFSRHVRTLLVCKLVFKLEQAPISNNTALLKYAMVISTLYNDSAENV